MFVLCCFDFNSAQFLVSTGPDSAVVKIIGGPVFSTSIISTQQNLLISAWAGHGI